MSELNLSLSELITSLSYALDITEGQPRGHSIRCCWIGMHVAEQMVLTPVQKGELYYTLLLKDTGCSSNAARLFQLYGSDDLKAKKNFKEVDSHKLLSVLKFIVDHTTLDEGRLKQFKRIMNFVKNGKTLTTELIQTRCERGASITKRLGFSDEVANSVRHLDEHYNGEGRPSNLKGEAIPLYSRIALLSQVADVFYQIGGPAAAEKEIAHRRGTWFDPAVTEAFFKAAKNSPMWEVMQANEVETKISSMEPPQTHRQVDEDYLDIMARAFADIIDAKSPFTYGHSSRVAAYADIVAEAMGIDAARRRWFYRASLLHDIGKLGVSNAILDKPAKLTDEEFAQIKLHSKYTEEILSKISIFKELAVVAGGHHERLDGKGYHRGVKSEQICTETRILTLADIFDALSAKRPYRDAMPVEKVINILEEMRGTAVDGSCLDALKKSLDRIRNKMQPAS